MKDAEALLSAAVYVRGRLHEEASRLRKYRPRYLHRQHFTRGKIHALEMAIRRLTRDVIRDGWKPKE